MDTHERVFGGRARTVRPPAEGDSLQWYAWSGQVGLLAAALDGGGSVHEQDTHGRDALMYACAGGHLEAAKMLVERGADPTHTDSKSRHGLNLAVIQNHVDVVQWFVEGCTEQPFWKCLPNIPDDMGYTPLVHAVVGGAPAVGIVDLLLSHSGLDLLAEIPIEGGKSVTIFDYRDTDEADCIVTLIFDRMVKLARALATPPPEERWAAAKQSWTQDADRSDGPGGKAAVSTDAAESSKPVSASSGLDTATRAQLEAEQGLLGTYQRRVMDELQRRGELGRVWRYFEERANESYREILPLIGPVFGHIPVTALLVDLPDIAVYEIRRRVLSDRAPLEVTPADVEELTRAFLCSEYSSPVHDHYTAYFTALAAVFEALIHPMPMSTQEHAVLQHRRAHLASPAPHEATSADPTARRPRTAPLPEGTSPKRHRPKGKKRCPIPDGSLGRPEDHGTAADRRCRRVVLRLWWAVKAGHAACRELDGANAAGLRARYTKTSVALSSRFALCIRLAKQVYAGKEGGVWTQCAEELLELQRDYVRALEEADAAHFDDGTTCTRKDCLEAVAAVDQVEVRRALAAAAEGVDVGEGDGDDACVAVPLPCLSDLLWHLLDRMETAGLQLMFTAVQFSFVVVQDVCVSVMTLFLALRLPRRHVLSSHRLQAKLRAQDVLWNHVARAGARLDSVLFDEEASDRFAAMLSLMFYWLQGAMVLRLPEGTNPTAASSDSLLHSLLFTGACTPTAAATPYHAVLAVDPAPAAPSRSPLAHLPVPSVLPEYRRPAADARGRRPRGPATPPTAPDVPPVRFTGRSCIYHRPRREVEVQDSGAGDLSMWLRHAKGADAGAAVDAFPTVDGVKVKYPAAWNLVDGGWRNGLSMRSRNLMLWRLRRGDSDVGAVTEEADLGGLLCSVAGTLQFLGSVPVHPEFAEFLARHRTDVNAALVAAQCGAEGRGVLSLDDVFLRHPQLLPHASDTLKRVWLRNRLDLTRENAPQRAQLFHAGLLLAAEEGDEAPRHPCWWPVQWRWPEPRESKVGSTDEATAEDVAALRPYGFPLADHRALAPADLGRWGLCASVGLGFRCDEDDHLSCVTKDDEESLLGSEADGDSASDAPRRWQGENDFGGQCFFNGFRLRKDSTEQNFFSREFRLVHSAPAPPPAPASALVYVTAEVARAHRTPRFNDRARLRCAHYEHEAFLIYEHHMDGWVQEVDTGLWFPMRSENGQTALLARTELPVTVWKGGRWREESGGDGGLVFWCRVGEQASYARLGVELGSWMDLKVLLGTEYRHSGELEDIHLWSREETGSTPTAEDGEDGPAFVEVDTATAPWPPESCPARPLRVTFGDQAPDGPAPPVGLLERQEEDEQQLGKWEQYIAFQQAVLNGTVDPVVLAEIRRQRLEEAEAQDSAEEPAAAASAPQEGLEGEREPSLWRRPVPAGRDPARPPQPPICVPHEEPRAIWSQEHRQSLAHEATTLYRSVPTHGVTHPAVAYRLLAGDAGGMYEFYGPHENLMWCVENKTFFSSLGAHYFARLPGADAGPVLFTPAAQGADPAALLFTAPRAGATEGDAVDALQEYFSAGRLMGYALARQFTVGGAQLARGYYRVLLAHPLTLDDVRWVDVALHGALRWVLDTPRVDDAAELYFMHRGEGLVAGGAQLRVTDANKADFVTRTVHALYLAGVEARFHAFASGFWTEAPAHLTRFLLTAEDLAGAFGPGAAIDPTEWEEATGYECVGMAEEPVVRWFWRYVASLAESDRRVAERDAAAARAISRPAPPAVFLKQSQRPVGGDADTAAAPPAASTTRLSRLLLFATGLSTLPLGGFPQLAAAQAVRDAAPPAASSAPPIPPAPHKLAMTISTRATVDNGLLAPDVVDTFSREELAAYLPTSLPCTNTLYIPPYASYEELAARFDTALAYGSEGLDNDNGSETGWNIVP